MSPCLYWRFFRALDWAGVQDAFAECALGTLSAVLLVFSPVSAGVHIVHDVNRSNKFIFPCAHFEVSLCRALSCFDTGVRDEAWRFSGVGLQSLLMPML